MLNFDGSSSAPNARMRSSGTPGSSRDVAPSLPDRLLATCGTPEVALHHVHREPVDARGHRRVGGEHRARAHHGQRGVEVQSAVGDEFADALDAEEPGVPLVHVEHLRLRQPLDGGERADRPHPADTRQDLLLDAVFLVAAVEPVGHAAQVVLVLRDVGIQEQQRNSTDLRDPHARVELRRSPASPAIPAPASPASSVSSRSGSPCGSSAG